MEIDALLVRSFLYLMSLDELLECSHTFNAELLEMLHIFTNKAPLDIEYSNFQVKWNHELKGLKGS